MGCSFLRHAGMALRLHRYPLDAAARAAGGEAVMFGWNIGCRHMWKEDSRFWLIDKRSRENVGVLIILKCALCGDVKEKRIT